jgi:aquaporin Z
MKAMDEIEAGGAISAQRMLKVGAHHDALQALRRHWPEYLMESGELGLFMLSACAFATLLQHPASPVTSLIGSNISRRAVMGVAMGGTAILIVMSPWGKQSGAHFNPAVTLTFFRLGRVKLWDALFYVVAQFFGGALGVGLASALLRGAVGHSAVRYATTVPGACGIAAAFIAELIISFGLMLTILFVSNREPIARFTPYFAGVLVATYICVEAPLSGMSMNPARTFASAFHAMYWHALWIYFTAPPLGMLAAAEVFLRTRGGAGPKCAKLHHANNKRCIFRCGYVPAQITNN